MKFANSIVHKLDYVKRLFVISQTFEQFCNVGGGIVERFLGLLFARDRVVQVFAER